MPSKSEFITPSFHTLHDAKELMSWSERLIKSLVNVFKDIQLFKMSTTGTGRVVNQTVAAGFTVNNDGLFIFLDSAGAVTSDVTTAVASGITVGEQLVLLNVGANNITIKNGANTAIGGDIVLGTNDTLALVWNGTDWIRLYNSNN